MKAKVLFLAMAFGGSWAQVQAEPAVQAGDTLESLSQVKITTSTHPKVQAEQQVQAAAPMAEEMVSVEEIDQPELPAEAQKHKKSGKILPLFSTSIQTYRI